jgi:glutathione S-transferase
MRRLFLTHRSPYARKVWLVLTKKNLPVELEVVDLANRSPEFVAISPLGKVPVLVDDDGTVVCDSTVICEYLEDRYTHVPVRPEGWEARLAVRALEELADSLADQAIAIFFGGQNGQPTEKARGVAGRILASLDATAPADGGPFCGSWTYADAAVLSALGYWTFRLGKDWRAAAPNLAAWFDAQDAAPEAVATRPQG